jgi:hypothetical protein
MKRLYLIRREDFFQARSLGQLPEGCVLECGSIWITVSLDLNERKRYQFPIALLSE